jgi:hypothetical protein
MAIRKSKPGVKDGVGYTEGAGTEQHDGVAYDEEHRSMDELATGGRVMARHHAPHEGDGHHHGTHHVEHDGHGHHSRHHGDGHIIHIGRKDGGRLNTQTKSGRSDEQGEEGSGNPEFFGGGESPSAKAAHGDEEAKRGGRIKKGKRKERKRGGRMVEGRDAKKRLDRSRGGRTRMPKASGGGIGSDKHPLTEANRLTSPKGDRRTANDDPEDD